MKRVALLVILILLPAACTPSPPKTPRPLPTPTIAVPQKAESEAKKEPPATEAVEPEITEEPAPANTPTPLPTAKPAAPRLAAADKMDLWVNGPHLRGANIWQALVIPELDGLEFKGDGAVGPPFTQADFDALAAAGANYVSLSTPGLFTEKPPFQLDPAVQDNLDHLLEMAANADLFVTIGFRTGPGRSEFGLCCSGEPGFEPYYNDTMWQDPAAQDAWVEMWRYTAQRYRDNPVVAGYKLMVEPNSAGLLLDIYEPDEFYAQYRGTLYDWNQLYPRIVAAIREVDPNTPILIGGNGWSGVLWLPYIQPVGDPRTVYIIHQYEPQDDYTHQEQGGTNTYPGQFDVDGDGEADTFDRAWLEDFLQPVADFSAEHGAAVAVDEFGVNRWVPGAAQFMDDQMALFEQMGMNMAFWEWPSGWQPFVRDVNDMVYQFGPDPGNTTPTPNDLWDVVQKYWARNTVRPSNFYTGAPKTEPETETSALTGVQNWFYMINVNLEPEMVQQIVNSNYDLVVLDYIPSEVENTGFPMAQVIEQLHNAPHPKLVIAYIDIGQAEDYRTYWQPGWGIGNPEWITGLDPDGWEGNYPVAYWDDDWRNIWLADNGYIPAIVEAGFDGMYLDWVEAYSDENVIAAAQADGVDPRQEMVWWVADLAETARSRNPDFIVIGQNAAELAADEEYRDTIDAIAQEQVWFDGGADNHPPGDCPLPRTDADVDSAAYRDSLSPACRRQFDEFPNSTLHVSSQEYLRDLQAARNWGLTIFTVDYALQPENVARVYRTSRELGFIPFVSNRALDQFVEPFPRP